MRPRKISLHPSPWGPHLFRAAECPANLLRISAAFLAGRDGHAAKTRAKGCGTSGGALQKKRAPLGTGFAPTSCCLEHELRDGAPAVTLRLEAILGLEAQPEGPGVEGAKPGSLPARAGKGTWTPYRQVGAQPRLASQDRLCPGALSAAKSLPGSRPAPSPSPRPRPPTTTPRGRGEGVLHHRDGFSSNDIFRVPQFTL